MDDPISEQTFFWKINRTQYRRVRSRDGRYLLRSNQTSTDPSELWKQYMILTEVEEAFRNLKGDLAIRPIYHQLEHRCDAHIFVAFLSYCLHVTLRQSARSHAEGPDTPLDSRAGCRRFRCLICTSPRRTDGN